VVPSIIHPDTSNPYISPPKGGGGKLGDRRISAYTPVATGLQFLKGEICLLKKTEIEVGVGI
jgi:hypothetical protein